MKRKAYSKQFKEEVVRTMETGDKSPALLARELGVRRNQLYKWQKQVRLKGASAFPGPGMPSRDALTEVEQLRRKVAILEEENQFLKKAELYFTANPE